MLTLSASQFTSFQNEAAVAFEDEMVVHCKEFSPSLAAVLGDDRVRTALRAMIHRAQRHGFTFRGPVRLFIELSLLFGSHFDCDVQYPWARGCLGEPDVGTQMRRADALCNRATDVLEEIHGTNNSYTRMALQRLQTLSANLPELGARDSSVFILTQMAHIHPQKYTAIGEPSQRALIAIAEAEANRHGVFRRQDVLLFAVLMFSFGQGCTRDLLYPWIASTLANEQVSGPSARVNQLQKKAKTWLRHVLADNRQTDV